MGVLEMNRNTGSYGGAGRVRRLSSGSQSTLGPGHAAGRKDSPRRVTMSQEWRQRSVAEV